MSYILSSWPQAMLTMPSEQAKQDAEDEQYQSNESDPLFCLCTREGPVQTRADHMSSMWSHKQYTVHDHMSSTWSHEQYTVQDHMSSTWSHEQYKVHDHMSSTWPHSTGATYSAAMKAPAIMNTRQVLTCRDSYLLWRETDSITNTHTHISRQMLWYTTPTAIYWIVHIQPYRRLLYICTHIMVSYSTLVSA